MNPLTQLQIVSPQEQSAIDVHNACRTGNIADVKTVLQDLDINAKIDQTLLHTATVYNHVDIASLLLKDGRIDVNGEKHAASTTPLYVAACYGHLEILQMLLQHPQIELDEVGWQALHAAVRVNSLEAANLLINDLRVRVNCPFDDNATTLVHKIIEKGNGGLLEKLLQRKDWDVNQTGAMLDTRLNSKTFLFPPVIEGTPFACACYDLYHRPQNSSSIVEILLQDPRVDVNSSIHGQLSNFHVFCERIHKLETMELFLNKWDMKISGEEFRDALKKTSKEILGIILAKSMESEPLRNLIQEACQGQLDDFPETHQQCFQKYGDSSPSQLIKNLWAERFAVLRSRDLFAMIVLLCEGLFDIKENEKELDVGRFFKIAKELPMDLQMVLANITAGSTKDVISGKACEIGLRSIVKLIEN